MAAGSAALACGAAYKSVLMAVTVVMGMTLALVVPVVAIRPVYMRFCNDGNSHLRMRMTASAVRTAFRLKRFTGLIDD